MQPSQQLAPMMGNNSMQHRLMRRRHVGVLVFIALFIVSFGVVGTYVGVAVYRRANTKVAETSPQQIVPAKTDVGEQSPVKPEAIDPGEQQAPTQSGGTQPATKQPAQPNSGITIQADVLTLSNAVDMYQKNLGIKLSIVRSPQELSQSGLDYFGRIEATSDNDATVLALTSLIYTEWRKYPSGFLAKVGLKEVAIVGNINNGGYQVAAMPRAEDKDVVYYSTHFGTDTYMKRVTHHELDHLIEYNAHGSYYGSGGDFAACNAPTFSYGSGGIGAYAGSGVPAYQRHPTEGLIDGYSTYGVEEDKAQIYTELWSNIGFLNELSASDARLACKKQAYLKTLQSYDGSITEVFLKNLPAIPTLTY